MQTMPIASCSQRKYVASGGTGGADGCELNDMLLSSQGTLSISVRSVTRAAYWYAICQSASHSSGVAGLSMQRPWQHPLLGEKSGSASSRGKPGAGRQVGLPAGISATARNAASQCF